MKNAQNEYELATLVLKRALKKQRITYRDLASAIGMSESGIKKVLGARDGSLLRLAQIAQHLGLRLQEVFSGENEGVEDIFYSEKQQKFLLSEPKALELFWRLAYERSSLEEAESAMGLSSKQSFALLRRLDQNQLLKLLPEGRLRVPPIRPIRWAGDGPLVRKLYKEWSAQMVGSLAKPEPGPHRFFSLRYFKVRPSTHQELMQALRELEAEFVRRAIHDMRSEDPDLVHLRWILAVDDRSFFAV